MNGKSNLLRMLVDSDDEDEGEDNSRKSTTSTSSKHITQQPQQTNNRNRYSEDDERFSTTRIPDTCNFQPGRIFGNRPSGANATTGNDRFIIRDTLDSNYDELFPAKKITNNNRQSTDNAGGGKRVVDARAAAVVNDLEETACFNEEAEDAYLANLDTSQHAPVNKNLNKVATATTATGENMNSTPLAVRKKLQETGLQDLTNSVMNVTGVASPPQKPSTLAITPKKSVIDSPLKYIQMRLSPISESPFKKSSGHQTTAGQQASKTTPTKFMLLTTPTKSPSVIRLNSHQPDGIDNNQDKSMDYSFEFREQLLKNSKNKIAVATAASGTDQTSVLKQTAKPTQQSISTTRAKMSASERNLADVAQQCESFLMSPGSKNATGTSQNRAKKLKQLTMAQAFASAASNDKPATVASAGLLSGMNKSKQSAVRTQIDFDETCLPEESLQQTLNDNVASAAGKLHSIKNEPNDHVCN
jgi:hypothetical protein